jgi:uncharacterized protein YggE
LISIGVQLKKTIMKKLVSILPLFFVALLLNESATAQIAGNEVFAEKNVLYNNPSYQSNPVDLSIQQYNSSFSPLLEANVMINVKADSYVAIFSLTQYAKTIEEAEAAMRTRTQIFTSLLQQKNIGEQNIFIDPVSMVPTYETELTEKKLSKTFNEVPTGFEMKKNVHITFKDQHQINDIITTAAKAEVYDLVKVDYNVEGKDAIIEQLRNEALGILMNKKMVLEKAGIHTRFVNVGEKQGSAFPGERYSQYVAYKAGTAPYQIANSRKDKPIQTVQYNYADKQKTVYYDKVTDKQFDKIIHPTVGEPMVQIYFSLKGQFVIYDPEKELADKIYNDKIKQLQLKEMEMNLDLRKKEAEWRIARPMAVEKK